MNVCGGGVGVVHFGLLLRGKQRAQLTFFPKLCWSLYLSCLKVCSCT